MVNYRRVVCEVAVLAALVMATGAAPAAPAAPDCKHTTHYDQRQNGTDNIRVHVDGVVVAVLPAESLAESLLSALPDLNELLEEEDFVIQKPKPPQTEAHPVIPAAPSKPEEAPLSTPDKDQVAESSSIKPTESTSEVGSTAQPTKNQKKEQYLKQRKAQRVKNYLASFLIPLLRKNRHQ